MKRKFVGMTNKEWINKHKKKTDKGYCPELYLLDNHFGDKCWLHSCWDCWNVPAKRNGRWILKEVKKQ